MKCWMRCVCIAVIWNLCGLQTVCIAADREPSFKQLPLQEPAPAANEWYHEQRELYFGVPVQVRFQGPDAELATAVWDYLEGIDDCFNDYRDDTEIAAINSGKKGEHSVSQQMSEALQIALQAHVLTSEAFDISVGPLRRLWKHAAQTAQMPTQDEIQNACIQVGMDKIYLANGQLYVLADAVSLDFGGIIKGIAVDHAMGMLRDAGKVHALVQVGGETAAMGLSTRQKPHAFAIPHPKNPSEIWAIVQDSGSGYSGCTSGNYRLPIMINGRPFYHIFDPRSGLPCAVHVLSVSVIFPQIGRNGLADALSTAGVVMGPETFIPLVESLGGDCLLLTENPNDEVLAHESRNWQRYVRKTP